MAPGDRPGGNRVSGSGSSGQGPVARAASIVAFGICAAMVAGLIHYGQLVIADHWLGSFRWFSREFPWMAPISYGLVLVPGSALCAGIALFAGRRDWFPVAVACIVTIAAFAVLLPFPQLGRPAALVLAVGVGVAFARLVRHDTSRRARLTIRFAIASIIAVPVLALLQHRARERAEARALVGLPTPGVGSPNVILVVLDAARAKSMGFVGGRMGTTPQLNAWAASGTVFEKAFSTAPWTLPSHASMLSGLYPSEMDADWTVPIDTDHPVLPELLRDAGYATAAFVANLHYTAWDSGLERGFMHFDDYQRDWAQTIRSSSLMQTALADTLLRVPRVATLRNLLTPDLSIVPQHRYRSRLGAEVIDAFLQWQGTHPGRPYFALLNLMDPHLVTTALDEDRRRYPHDERGDEDYLAAMRYLDAEVARLLSTLQQQGTLDETIVILTSDHGELLGEHGISGHAQSVYKDVLHVPLWLRWPSGVPAGLRVTRAVTLRDLAATVLDLTGVSRGALPGASLAQAWRDTATTLSPVVAEVRQQPNPLGDYPTATGALSALFDEQMYYIQNHGTGQEQLFAYATDTGEVADLAKDAAAERLLAPWRARLARFRHRREQAGLQ